jgi:hypothetical protein
MNLGSAAARRGRNLHALALLALAFGCDDPALAPNPPGSGAGGAFGTGTGGTDVFFSGGSSTTGGVGRVGSGGVPTQLLSGKSAHSERAAPILGGTLLVTRDGSSVVAADPDRDVVFLVDLHTLSVRSLAFEDGDQPGRVLEGPAGRVFVLTRGSGTLVALDVASGEIEYRVPVCRTPRGIDYDAASGSLFVACRSGLLLNLDEKDGSVLARLQFDEDLRDVLVRGKELLLTRARSAEVLVVSEAGEVVRRAAPLGTRPSHLFRSVLLPSGEILLAHQNSDPQTGPPLLDPGDDCRMSAVAPILSITSTEPPSASGAPAPADPRDQVPVPAMAFDTFAIAGLLGPLDLALAPEAGKFALLASGNAWNPIGPRPTLVAGPLGEKGGLSGALRSTLAACGSTVAKPVAGEPIAVALDPKGRVYVQSREPAALVLDNGVSISLSKVSRADTGLALFYMNAGGALACASCHPEGEEDGLSWPAGSSMRRTPSLAGGLSARAPYQWTGEFATLGNLIKTVFSTQLAAHWAPTTAQVETLGAWLEQLPSPQVAEQLDMAAVERGRAQFFDGEGACGDCHAGSDFSDHLTHDVGTAGPFKTPSLLGVSARAPYFHDGCALELRGIFGACGGKDHGRDLPASAKSDLIEFLRSL